MSGPHVARLTSRSSRIVQLRGSLLFGCFSLWSPLTCVINANDNDEKRAPLQIGHHKKILKNIRRWLYELRSYVPGLREQHHFEKMVGPVGFWNELQRYQFGVVERNGLKPNHTLLDIGCGPLQGGIAFIRYLEPGGYTGVDIQPRHVAAARRQIERYRLESKKPRIIESAAFGDEVLRDAGFNYMWASQILYYFDEKKLSELFAMARRRLKPGGKLLGDFIDPDRFDAIYYPGCNFLRYPIEKVQSLAEAQGLRALPLGKLLDFNYPRRLLLRTSVMMEMTPAQ
jgi:SAM-dependent methyltransferase